MKAIQNIFNVFVHSNGLLACTVTSMVAAFSIIYGVRLQLSLLLIPFFVTIFAYHINKIAEKEEDEITHGARTQFLNKHRLLLDGLSIVFYLVAVFLALLHSIIAFMLVLLPPLMVVLYSFKLHTSLRRLKDITLCKNVVISLTIVIFTSFLTIIYNNLSINAIFYIMGLFLFLRILITTILCDLRDEVADRYYNIPTLPVVLGHKNTIYLLLIINTLAGLLLISAVFAGLLPTYVYFLDLITFYGYFVILKMNDKKANQAFLCDVLADGEFILWPFLLMMGQIIYG